MSSTILPKDFDINKVTYDPINTIEGVGGKAPKKQIFIRYAGNLLRFQTPFAISPFGVAKSYEGEDWIVDLDIDRVDVENIEGASDFKQPVLNSKLAEFKEMLVKLNSKNVEHLVSQYTTLYPNKKPKDANGISEDVYNSIVKKPKDTKYSDVFRAKLPQPYFNKNGKKSFTVFGRDKQEIDWYNKDGCVLAYQSPWSAKRMLVQAIICCTGMWIINDKISCGFKIEQIQVRKPVELVGFAFKNNDGELEEEDVVPAVVPVVTSEVVPVVVPVVTPAEVEQLVEDEEEEFEDE